MAFAASYVNGYHLGQMLIRGGTPGYNLDSDTIRVSLYTDSITGQDKNANEVKGSGAFASNEVSYTGATPAAAQTLTNPTITVGSGKVIFSAGSATTQWTDATWTCRGAVIWDDTLTTPADPVICCINFGSDRTVTAGTFTITWDATNGIFYASY